MFAIPEDVSEHEEPDSSKDEYIPQNVDNSTSSESENGAIQDEASSLELQQTDNSQIDEDSKTHTEEQSHCRYHLDVSSASLLSKKQARIQEFVNGGGHFSKFFFKGCYKSVSVALAYSRG